MAGLMAGKRGLIMGVANQKSIAYGIAKAAAAEGAELAFTYQNEMIGKRVEPLAEALGSAITIPNDVAEEGVAEKVVARLSQDWERLDFVVHALAFANKDTLKGDYMTIGRDDFLQAVLISPLFPQIFL